MLVEDIRNQDKLQRALEIRLGVAVMEAIANGTHPDRALAAVQNILKNEERCKQSRVAAERTYR